MKLNEIIQSTIKTLPQTKNAFNPTAQEMEHINNGNFLTPESGMHSHVKPGNNEWEIQKKSNKADTDKNDPFFKFATFLMDRDLMNTNPFFPRIYNIETQKDENGLRMYNATIEKLQPITVMDVPSQDAMGNSLCDVNGILEFVNDPNNVGANFYFLEYKKTSKIKSESLLILLSLIGIILLFDKILIRYIKNNELRIALKAIIEFMHTNHLISDVHDANFMVRQGGTGYQLVLNDLIGGTTPLQ